MAGINCRRCGQGFATPSITEGADYFCCAGCAIKHRVPVDAQGQFPVNAPLVSVLVLGFLFFNQLLFWMLSALVVHNGKPELAMRMQWVSAGLALLVWLGFVMISLRERVMRRADYGVALGLLGLHALALCAVPPYVVCMAGANLLFILWCARGLRRARFTAN